MEKIYLDSIILDSYDTSYDNILKEFSSGNSNSKFIHNIKERVELSKTKDKFSLETGYIVLNKKLEPIGYVFISGIKNDILYLEYSILKEQRKKGYATRVLEEVSNYLFENYNIKQINLDIDPSNEASIKTAEKCNYVFDEDEFENNNYTGKMSFIKENPFYLSKRRK